MISITLFILAAVGVVWLTMCAVFGLLRFTFRCAGMLVILPALLVVAIPVGLIALL